MKAFTLIELLIVMSIILLLSAILFPVLKTVQIKAKSIQTLSNMSQIGRAWYMYSDNNDQRLMPFALYDSHDSKFWWANYNGTLDYNSGILSPYINNISVNNDPLFTDRTMDWVGFKGFGYNYFYLSPTYSSNYQGINYSEISAPSSIVAFGTTALPYNGLAIGNPYFVPTSIGIPTFQGRVNNKGIVIWCDLHANIQSIERADMNNLGYLGNNDDSFRN